MPEFLKKEMQKGISAAKNEENPWKRRTLTGSVVGELWGSIMRGAVRESRLTAIKKWEAWRKDLSQDKANSVFTFKTDEQFSKLWEQCDVKGYTRSGYKPTVKCTCCQAHNSDPMPCSC